MLRLVLFVSLATAAFSLPTDYNRDWARYKLRFHKHYSPEEDAMRRVIFCANLDYINRHNSEHHTFTLGVNNLTDMTNAEYNAKMNGYIMRPRNPKAKVFTATKKSLRTLPDSVDWRTKGYVTPIKNQGECGSCWAFSATGSLEGQHFKKTSNLVSLSEQNLVDCSRKEGNKGCEGGLMDQAFEYVKKNKGIDTEKSYSYKARDEKCHFKRADVGATVTGFVDVQKGSELALQKAVAEIGPISVAIDASHPSFQEYHGGIYIEPKCSSVFLDHGVLAVGYGSLDGQDYWIVKNSWGTDWGDKGYIKMARNHNNMCGIATVASYPRM